MKPTTMQRAAGSYILAQAAGTDAANRLMRQKNLKAWDRECYDKAAETFHRLYGHDFLKSFNNGQCPECDT